MAQPITRTAAALKAIPELAAPSPAQQGHVVAVPYGTPVGMRSNQYQRQPGPSRPATTGLLQQAQLTTPPSVPSRPGAFLVKESAPAYHPKQQWL